MNKYRPWRVIWIFLSALLCVGVFCCYGWRADAVAAITVFPAWVWLLMGLLLMAFSFHRHATRPYYIFLSIVGMLWLIYLAAFVEEPRSILRAVFPQPKASNHTLRIITLNCAGGSAAAAAEAKRFQPDIVLWQEIPGRKEVMQIAQQILGPHAEVVMGLDTAIAARGRVEAKPLPREMQRFCVQARVHLAEGRAVDVVSLHLLTPPLRVDLWSTGCWRAQRNQRQVQREQLLAIAKQLKAVPQTMPIIVAGDFNMPQGDAVFRLLQPRLRDSFREAGLGWGNTVTNEYPVLRIDQIWISQHFAARSVCTYRTQYSDHRMVVGDVVLR